MQQNQPNQPNTTADRLRAELESLTESLSTVLDESKEYSKSELELIRNKAQLALARSRQALVEANACVVQHTKEMAKNTDVYVHENPWKSIGIGAAAGLVLGFLLARR